MNTEFQPEKASYRPPGAARVAIRTATILLIFVTLFTALMAWVYRATMGPIAVSAEKQKMALISQVLPPTAYDNALLQDWIDLPPTLELGSSEPTRLYRARKNSESIALLFEATAADGYSGNIHLLLAVSIAGELLAVRVTEHRETPGLGDYIDPRKDRNKTQPWITQFNGISLTNVPSERWKVKRDGGQFDQRAGATISARAVTAATGRALAWATKRAPRLFATPTGQTFTQGD